MPEDCTLAPYNRPLTPIERLFTRSPFSIVSMVARIRGNVTEGMLREALSKLRQRHPNLRSRIVADEHGNPWLTSQGAGEVELASAARDSDEHWMRVVQESSRTPFEFEVRPAMRFMLLQSPDVCDLIILCHHILCDGLSLAYLARDLLLHLGDPSLHVQPLPDAVPMSLDNLPPAISANAVVRFMIGRMNKKWASEKVVFDQEDYLNLHRAYWAKYAHQVMSHELSEEQTSALVERCRSHEVTVNSALCAAFVGAQVAVQGQKPFHSSLMLAGSLRERLPHPPGEAMGFYAGAVTPKYRYDPARAFWDNAREFQRQVRPLFTDKNLFEQPLMWCLLDPTIVEAINFKRLGGLVPAGAPRQPKLAAFHARDDVVSSILKREKMDSLQRITTGAAVTNLGRLDFPRQYGALELERLIMHPGVGFPLVNFNLVLGAVTCAGKLSLVIEFVEDNLAALTMRQIRGRALEFLLE